MVLFIFEWESTFAGSDGRHGVGITIMIRIISPHLSHFSSQKWEYKQWNIRVVFFCHLIVENHHFVDRLEKIVKEDTSLSDTP